MIVTDHQQRLQDWLCTRLERSCSPNMRCIGNRSGAALIGVVGLDDWDEASVQMHVAGYGNWLTRDLLWATFDYAFNVAGVNVIYGLVPEVNTKSLRLGKHIGFKVEHVMQDAHPQGGLVLLAMRKKDCKYLVQGARYGKESRNACRA